MRLTAAGDADIANALKVGGTEVIVKALASGMVHSMCRPVVVGSAWSMERAVELTGASLTVREVHEAFDSLSALAGPGSAGARAAGVAALFGRATAEEQQWRSWVDDTLVGGALHQAACGIAKAVPASVPAIAQASVRLWGDRAFTDASHKVFATSRSVRFREMEYALPASAVGAAFDRLRGLIDDEGWRVSFPVEVRFAAADDRWLSTAYDRDTAYIAVHRYWREDPSEYFEAVEQIMLAHDGRPHWGKMHTLGVADLGPRYPRFADFVALRDRLDPDRLFGNRYLTRVLGE